MCDCWESGTIYKMYITTPLLQYTTTAHMTALVSPLYACVSVHQHDLCFKDTAG